jgi:hypothetical protein
MACLIKNLVRFHFEWVNTQNMEIIEYPISNTECPVSIFWNSITTANAVQGVRSPSVAKAMEGRLSKFPNYRTL